MTIMITDGHVQGSTPPEGTSCQRGHTSCPTNAQQWRLCFPKNSCVPLWNTKSSDSLKPHVRLHSFNDFSRSFDQGEGRKMEVEEKRDGNREEGRNVCLTEVSSHPPLTAMTA